MEQPTYPILNIQNCYIYRVYDTGYTVHCTMYSVRTSTYIVIYIVNICYCSTLYMELKVRVNKDCTVYCSRGDN